MGYPTGGIGAIFSGSRLLSAFPSVKRFSTQGVGCWQRRPQLTPFVSLGRHTDRPIKPDHLAVQHLVLDNVLD